jgi:hypothetical protein
MDIEPIYLLSYPRSGSTLCRTYMAILQGRPQISAYQGDVLASEAGPLTGELAGVRMVKTHHLSHVYERVVYLVRDGRNAMLSHLQLQFVHGGHSYSRPEDVLSGLRHLDEQGHFWGDHIANAVGHSEAADVLFVRYEDLIADPVSALARIVRFADRSVPESVLRECVAIAGRSRAYDQRDPSRLHRPEPGTIYASLVASPGGDYWRELLDVESRRWFHERGGTPHLRNFGYAVSEDWWQTPR